MKIGDEPLSLHDVIIIGGGPAGLTAAIYGSRAGLSTLLMEKGAIGGLMRWTDKIENYPGFLEVDPAELAEIMLKQAERFGARVIKAEVRGLEEEDGVFRVITDVGEFKGRSLIIAVGLAPRKLNRKGEELSGVSYCAVCDGPLYEGMDVFVIGSGDAAITDALFLSRIAREVSVVVKKPKLDAKKYLQESAFSTDNIKFIWNSVVEEILGEDGVVVGIKLRNLETNDVQELKGSAVFIKIGFIPNTEFLKGFIELTDEGFIRVYDESTLMTSRDGVFVAGDVREKIQRQIVTAAGDGCTVIESIMRYLDERKYMDAISREEKPVVASFWSSSTPTSRQKMLLDNLSKELGERIKTIEVDLRARKKIAERFKISSTPTIIIFKNGKEQGRISARINYDELLKKVGALLR